MRFLLRHVLCAALIAAPASAAPVFLDDQFELPPGFRIYRAASAELSGGSYDLTFDGQGRLLVGDGTAVRRLTDNDNDGVYDEFEVIAEGLGPRGPQGLLVYDDKLYATGGDGVQLFTGMLSGGKLLHRGRIGQPFNTGGDHASHTLLRGLDGYVYFNTGDGGGISDRKHITEASSPVLYERKASVFRIDPNGHHWECVSAGGRNPPSLGMNYLGELFSWDSDMEWHVDLPFYRPVRLNHWITGADQGWQSVGAYPPYYIDNVPPVAVIGRGSPTWGVFYEHFQFPEKYADSFIVCDYRWKSATSGGYNSGGRLVAFHLDRNGADWQASMEVLAQPKPGARDAAGQAINFALVDVDVAPDGSLFVTDHNQGVWRVVYDPEKRGAQPPVFDFNSLARFIPNMQRLAALEAVMVWPQPGAEWSRTTIENIHSQTAGALMKQLQEVALNEEATARKRMRAIRLLASRFAYLPAEFIAQLAASKNVEARGQAAWLIGIRGRADEVPLLLTLLSDTDAFVRRRAAESLTRVDAPTANDALIERLSDSDRTVRYVAMSALAHREPKDWVGAAMATREPQTVMRSLVAYSIRREQPPGDVLEKTVADLLDNPGMTSEDRLDFLRVLGLNREALVQNEKLRERIADRLLERFPDSDKNIRWEQARLLGEYGVASAAGKLLDALEQEEDGVTQFHLARALSRLAWGLDAPATKRTVNWLIRSQQGWFAQLDGKGRQFPDFWATVLSEFVEHRGTAFANRLSEIDLSGRLGSLVLEWVGDQNDGGAQLIELYQSQTSMEPRRAILKALKNVRQNQVATFLRAELGSPNNSRLSDALLLALANQASTQANAPHFLAGLTHEDPDVAGACALGLGRSGIQLREDLAIALLNLMHRHPSLVVAADQALRGIAKVKSPWSTERPRRPNAGQRRDVLTHWREWFEDQFGRPFKPDENHAQPRSNEELFDFLLSNRIAGGNPDRGREVYLKAQCADCHGGREKPSLLFGPDLVGVTQRLKPRELAEAIAYPSRVVAERFKAMEVELKDGESLTGFITEQTGNAIAIATKEKLHRINQDSIAAIRPQKLSLMPEGLTSLLTDEELRDLMTYLQSLTAK